MTPARVFLTLGFMVALLVAGATWWIGWRVGLAIAGIFIVIGVVTRLDRPEDE